MREEPVSYDSIEMDTETAETTNDLAVAVMKALGIDSLRVTHLTINFEGYIPATVSVKFLIPRAILGGVEGVGHEFAKYELVRKDKQPGNTMSPLVGE